MVRLINQFFEFSGVSQEKLEKAKNQIFFCPR